jgi:hypothetical protein
MRRRIIVAALLLVLGACPGGEPESITEQVRYPDDEGVVTDINLERVQIDSERSYTFSREVESFTTRGHDIMALLHHAGRYVHLGLADEGDVVVWIASIGIVPEGDDSEVLYNGLLESVDDEGRWVFEDGTVLTPDDGLEAPEDGSESTIVIDSESHRVVEVRAIPDG